MNIIKIGISPENIGMTDDAIMEPISEAVRYFSIRFSGYEESEGNEDAWVAGSETLVSFGKHQGFLPQNT
jgi:hypothetical protein